MVSYSVEPVIGGPAAPQTPLLSWGASPPRPPDLSATKYACTMIIVQLCRGSGGRSTAVLQGVWGAQPFSIAGGLPELQGVWGAQPPNIAGGLGGAASQFAGGPGGAAPGPGIAGGFGGAPGLPILTKICS